MSSGHGFAAVCGWKRRSSAALVLAPLYELFHTEQAFKAAHC